jgi:hypothetical protein
MKNLDFEIDKLTHSIENAITGENFPTEVLPFTKADLKQVMKKNGWKFNWKTEFENPGKETFKLILLHEPSVIQGLICLSIESDHVFMDLIESAPFNYGKGKQYR